MFQGSIVALVTPMSADGQIDWPCLHNLVEWHLQEGTNAIVAVGTTGESATLSVDEHCKVIKCTVDIVAKSIPVIAGTGANCTREAIELTQIAKDLGADAGLSVTPYYNKPTQEGLFLHHKAIAEAVDLPQVLYNVPGRTACDMQAETVRRLSKVNNIIGIKEATGDVERGRLIRQLCDDDFALWSGDDETFIDLMAVGAIGNISVTANIAPKQMSDICKMAMAGNIAAAKAANVSLMDVHEHLFCEANPIAVKWALEQMGKIPAGIRLPLTPLSAVYHSPVKLALQTAGLIK
ncbi:MAG: 4-hydroxy-tetrahydrodipicolinate synthase [Pseudomonadales bacterium]|nr:4-hydroxy-tetrahydrodipicolinate synthase [Pseudomonadales bacterium]